MISEIRASAAVVKVREGEGVVLEFTEAGHSIDKVRVIIQEAGLVGLELELKQIIDALGLDREKLLKDIELRSVCKGERQ